MVLPVTTESDDAAPSRSGVGRGRRIVLWVAGAILFGATAAVAALLAVSTGSDGVTSVLIGTLDSRALGNLALVAALSALAVGLCAIPVPRVWLLLLVPARLVAVAAAILAALVWPLTAPATVVPLVADGCDTGYVVAERSFLLAGWGTVYRQDGVFVSVVARTSGDDGYHPFADGAYTVVADGDSLRVWYNVSLDPYAAPVAAHGDPAFAVPARKGLSRHCGLSTAARTPLPAEPTPPAFSAADARAGVVDMAAASLAASLAPIRDSAGEPVDAAALAPLTTACNGDGTRTGLELAFATADNGASLARILAVWDAAGYAADRAMQEDIRYSETLPVEKMSIRDSTTIDGLIHLRLSSACSVR